MLIEKNLPSVHKHKSSISCKSATSKLSCQFDAANSVASNRNNNCDLDRKKKKVRTITLCFARLILLFKKLR